jgi:hypothetical protein
LDSAVNPEVDMSVCIAAICKTDENEARIIAMTDRKVSSIEFSNEDATTKSKIISLSWLAMFAGNDVSPCVPICEAASKRLKGQDSAEEVGNVFGDEYRKYLSNLAANKVLGRWQLTMEKFLDVGRKKFGPDVFDNLCHNIEQIKLSCRFLLCGFDSDGSPHVLSVSNPGIVDNHDMPGYYAIGDGAFAGLTILGFFRQSVVDRVPVTYYKIGAARLMAQSADTVGKLPFIWMLAPSGFIHVRLEPYRLIQQAWENLGKPSIPSAVIEELTKMLDVEEPLMP